MGWIDAARRIRFRLLGGAEVQQVGAMTLQEAIDEAVRSGEIYIMDSPGPIVMGRGETINGKGCLLSKEKGSLFIYPPQMIEQMMRAAAERGDLFFDFTNCEN